MSVLKRTKKKCDSLANNVKQMKSRQVFFRDEGRAGRQEKYMFTSLRTANEPHFTRTSLAQKVNKDDLPRNHENHKIRFNYLNRRQRNKVE